MKWFLGISTIEELKKKYRTLILKFHPDCYNGTDHNMKEINNEYEIVFKMITEREKFQGKANNNGGSVNDGFREVILKIINLEGIEIEICGSWIWVSGNTKPHKDIFKVNGFMWRSKKCMWSWNPPEAKTYNKKAMSMEHIREKYGSEKIGQNNSGDNNKKQKSALL